MQARVDTSTKKNHQKQQKNIKGRVEELYDER
jgi:hypothetical protein